MRAARYTRAQRPGSAIHAVIAICLTVSALAVLAGPAEASQKPTSKESKAIEKAFDELRADGPTIGQIRVSTTDEGFAAVFYEVVISPPSSAATSLERVGKAVKAPIPELFKKKPSGKWKPVPSAPKKVKKDLKAKGKTNIAITGDVVAFLHQRASCVENDPTFYSAGVYDKLGDVYLSVEFPSYRGPGAYDALGVHSVASLAVGTGGTSYQYETGQGNNAFAPSGYMHVDEGGWGIIEAGMARVPGEETYPITVGVGGYWVCG